ncbi:MAG: CopG family transcriptional regulator, partial [Zestosphaera sp.]
REKITAIEILKKQKIIYEADIAKKIRNRDAFFDRLEREGAVVLSLKDQRVAIDDEFWSEFVSKVESLTTDKDSEIAKILDKQEVALLKKLSESAIAYYERSKKKWVIKA